MLRSKKGFTLVELLAVIVILAIILAIAIPSISGVIENSKRNAFESDAKMLITGLEYQQLQATFGTAQIAVTDEKVLSSSDFLALGANETNYTTVKIVSISPLKLCVETPNTSKFGVQKATATKSTITDQTTTTCALYTE